MRYKTNIFLSFQQMFLQHLQKGFFVKRFLFSEAGGGRIHHQSEFHILIN